MNKNPIIAFLLAFFPGGGLMYLGKVLRGIFYTAVVIGMPIFGIIIFNIFFYSEALLFFPIGGALLLYLVNFIDTAVTASKLYNQTKNIGDETVIEKNPESERFFTIILSFIPGLGHFQLGLTYRGMTLLAAFSGLGIMILFVAMMTGRSEILVFLASLPIVWLYGFFDVMKQLEKKQQGEVLVDRSIFEDFESREGDGRKSKTIATLLSIIPGAGHLYLGLQKRGIQLMAAFLFSIYILDVMRLGIFLFLVPIIWFFSFFDGLQKAAKADDGVVEDEPIVSYLINHQRWLGIGLIALGVYYLGTNIVMPVLNPYIQNVFHIDIQYWFYQYFQTTILCLLLIGGGIKLMTGRKAKRVEEGEKE
ncbi:hypothetical protein [Lederbergia lenta]|uniref:Membrane protein n=1 Tax=Lederbergia lenta TaxID=1467 RepID=A0A2X4YP82_LEDLE|nr:hypothetical protein [Lederbergia lenta]MEC2325932.1 hypothetical protein [Lederbergia lenta]SQI53505.1 membrane protein [Lederbergia lenta]